MATKNSSLTVGERRTLAQHEEGIERGLGAFVEVGRHLISIRDERLYTDTSDTFEGYCKKRWNFTRQRAYQIIDSSKVVDTMSTIVDIQKPANEAQARVLAALPDEQTQATVWAKAVETAPKDADGAPKVTAAHVKKVADEIAQKMPNAKPAPPPVEEPDEPEPEPKATDAWGIPIQDHATEAFEAVEKFDELLSMLRKADKLYSEIAELPGGAYLQRPGVSINSRERWKHEGLKNAIYAVQDCKPTYTVCPYQYAEAKHDENCALCHGLNWSRPLGKNEISEELTAKIKHAFGVE